MKFSNILTADERIVSVIAMPDGSLVVATNRTLYQVQAPAQDAGQTPGAAAPMQTVQEIDVCRPNEG